jgi:hypothetical protein
MIAYVLKSNGSKIKLTQPVICYAILKDAGFIDQVNNQHYTFYQVKDDNGWSASLPLLRFFRNKIDPEHKYFETKMTIEIPGEVKEDVSKPVKEIVDAESPINAHELVDQIINPQSDTASDIGKNESPPLNSYNDVIQYDEDSPEKEIFNLDTNGIHQPSIVEQVEAKVEEVTSKPKNKSEIFSEFTKFLTRVFRTKSLDINKAAAPIHFVDGHMMLVSPSIFYSFIEHLGKEKIYEMLGGEQEGSNKKLMNRCQYKVFAENYHIKDIALKNIIQFQAVGERRKSKPISGILFKAEFMELITDEKFSDSRNIVLTSLVDLDN